MLSTHSTKERGLWLSGLFDWTLHERTKLTEESTTHVLQKRLDFEGKDPSSLCETRPTVPQSYPRVAQALSARTSLDD